MIDSQCEPFEILLNPKFNFRMNNSVFMVVLNFTHHSTETLLSVLLHWYYLFLWILRNWNLDSSVWYFDFGTPRNEWVNNIPYLSHSWRFYHQFSKDNATIKCRYLSGIYWMGDQAKYWKQSFTYRCCGVFTWLTRLNY